MDREGLKKLVKRVENLDRVLEHYKDVNKQTNFCVYYGDSGAKLADRSLDEKSLEKILYDATVNLRDELNEQIDNFCK